MSPNLSAFAAALGLVLAGGPLVAQAHHQPAAGYENCTLCDPWVYVDGAALWRPAALLPSFDSDETTPLVRARFEIGSFLPRLGLFGTMEFAPADGPSPTVTLGLKAWALPRSSDFNVTAGVGVVDYRQAVGESSPGAYVARGWAQAGVQYRTPVHELRLYAQAGLPLSGLKRPTYQLGLSHPIAPYRFHLGL